MKSLKFERVLVPQLLGQGNNDRIVIKTLFGDGALADVLSACLVEGLSMREDSNLLVAQLVLADFAHHVFSDDKVSLLEGVVLSFTVDLFHGSELDLNLLVLLSGHLIIEDRLEEGNHVVLGASEIPVFRNHIKHFQGVEVVVRRVFTHKVEGFASPFISLLSEHFVGLSLTFLVFLKVDL